MKTFIVFAAVIAIAASSAVRSSGWGAPPALPAIDLELGAAAAAAGAGSANAAQSLLELASGNANGPAVISSSSGVLAEVAQGEDIAQVAVANVPAGATSTINVVDVENLAYGGESVVADLAGANFVALTNTASSSSEGDGSIAAEESSLNSVISKKH